MEDPIGPDLLSDFTDFPRGVNLPDDSGYRSTGLDRRLPPPNMKHHHGIGPADTL